MKETKKSPMSISIPAESLAFYDGDLVFVYFYSERYAVCYVYGKTVRFHIDSFIANAVPLS